MLTIDASIWVNAHAPDEPGSAASRAFLVAVGAANTPIVVPTLLRVEVAAAITRSKKNPEMAREYTSRLAAMPNLQWIPLDEALAEHATSLALAHSLRGADAV